MRNRAKCSLCDDIIESFHQTDYIECSCGAIAIDGGEHKFEVFAHDFNNLIRIDDNDKEIEVKVIDKNAPDTNLSEEIPKKPARTEMISMLEEMINIYSKLPAQAIYSPINHADFCSALMLILSILKAE